MKYIKQKNDYTCGPVAIINVMKWAGYGWTSKHVDEIATVLHTTRERGTNDINLGCYLKAIATKYKMQVKDYIHPKHYDIGLIIENGGTVILGFNWPDRKGRSGHYVMIDKVNMKGFRVINAFKDGPAETWITWEDMKKWTKGIRTRAWSIKRKE